jgi:hypothetical protein
MLPAAVVVLIAGHIGLPYLLSHMALSAAVVSTLIGLMAVKHLGLLAGLLALLIGGLRGRVGRRSD